MSRNGGGSVGSGLRLQAGRKNRRVRAERIMHGKSSAIDHDGKGLFKGLPNPIEGGRYHSLILDPDSVPDELEITATTSEGEIMGIRHKTYPLEGIQFHPESILTEHGKQMLANFLDRL